MPPFSCLDIKKKLGGGGGRDGKPWHAQFVLIIYTSHAFLCLISAKLMALTNGMVMCNLGRELS